MRIHIAADHGGFEAKRTLTQWLVTNGYAVVDHGAYELQPQDDYPEYALQAVSALEGEDLAILLCRTGEGMAAVANKCRGVIASVAWNAEVAVKAREHNHAQVLALPTDFLTPSELELICKSFIDTKPSLEERHVRRVSFIKQLPQ